jgi:hypothetical protein
MLGIFKGGNAWYSGTSDSKPVFGEKPAEFRDQASADARARALAKLGYSTEVRPLAEAR